MKFRIPTTIILASALAVLSLPAHAVPHISGNYWGPRDHVRPLQTTVEYSREFPKRAIRKVINPPVGVKKIAVILVNFASADSTTSGSQTMTAADIVGFNGTFGYLRNFYKEASCNNLSLTITYYFQGGSVSTLTGLETPFPLTKSMEYYGTGDEGSSATGIQKLIADALALAPSVTYPAFDAVLVAHAGYGNESTYTTASAHAGDVWSAMVGLDGNPNGFPDGATFPARESGTASPIGVTCHEFGHLLGFVDMYDTGQQKAIIGQWCLYDQGTWIDDGAHPAHPNVWLKKLVGWVQPTDISMKQLVTGVDPIELSSSSVYSLPVLGSPDEYFLVVFTTTTPYNPREPGQGMLIWHIDEGTIDGHTLADRLNNNAPNSNSYSHNTVSLVPAGSVLPNVKPYGTKDDPWPGIKGVFTSPDSDSYTGQSGISIFGIQFVNGQMQFQLRELTTAGTLSISKVITFPNPAGSGYPSRGKGVLTTFAMNFSRPPQNTELTIFTVTGEQVLSVPRDKFTLNMTPSSDLQWVYEYDWDGKNQDGDSVAPGVYLYRVKTDTEVKTGKLAIVR